MTIGRPAQTRFTVDCLLAPRAVAVIGSDTADGQRVVANLREAGFARPLYDVPSGGDLAASIAGLPEAPDLAILATGSALAGTALAALASLGTRAAVVTGEMEDLPASAKAAGIRALGPRSFGVASPAIGLNTSLSHMKLPAGRVALVTQSASLTRAVIDWAGPNGVGFSHVVGIGGNADIGFGMVLDWLSRDPGTSLILMDIRRVRARRAFISAARAASRLRPVVALRPGGRLADPSGRQDGVFAAALRRAGVLVADGLEPFLAAAEVLSRARPLRGDALAVITNAIGPGRLAADAALAAGIKLAVLPPHAQAALAGTMPAEMTQGLIYAGRTGPTAVADIAAMVSAVPEVGGVLLMLAPTGPADSAAIEAVIAASATARLPVLNCVMGETTGSAHRRRLAEAGLPVFATPEQAVRAFGHLLNDREARLAARELPGSLVLDVAPDHAAVAAILAGDDRDTLRAARLLEAYGIGAASADAARCATIETLDDPMFGPAIAVAARPEAPPAYELPPLNLTLAQALVRRAGIAPGAAAQTSAALVRIGQLLVDVPQIESLRIGRLTADETGAAAGDLSLVLRPPGSMAVLAIPPYPEHLAASVIAGGQPFLLRPIRPEDAAAHEALMARVPREDMRFRFFSAIQRMPPEQVARLTQIDYEREMAFIAIRPADGATVGVARLVRDAEPGEAEFAILVEPSVKGTGLATILMRRLIAWGESQGIGRIVGQVLADNQPMLRFVRHLDFREAWSPGEPDIVSVALDLPVANAAQAG